MIACQAKNQGNVKVDGLAPGLDIPVELFEKYRYEKGLEEKGLIYKQGSCPRVRYSICEQGTRK